MPLDAINQKTGKYRRRHLRADIFRHDGTTTCSNGTITSVKTACSLNTVPPPTPSTP
jgi:hypothetical protein